MVTRLSTSDASFYRLEDTATPMYVGSLSILRRPRAGLSYEALLATIEQRLAQIPRYRQKVREVIGMARPVWIDDRDFDITYHVRQSALPSPGSDEQLHELIARLAARPLDKSRPLWEMYLVEGLTKDRVALYTKSHQALINGMTALEIGHVIADRTRRPPPIPEDIWVPEREPGNTRLVLGALSDWVMGPGAQLQAVGSAVAGLATNYGEWLDAGRRAIDFARTMARGTAPSSPLNARVSRHRRFTVARGNLEDYRTIRARYDCDVNDVVLAVVAGALSNWLLSRGEAVSPPAAIRAMAPLSVYSDGQLDSTGPGQTISQVTPFLVDLPVGEGNAVVRLSQIAHATESNPPGRPFRGGLAGRGGQGRGAAVADRARHRIEPDGRQPGRRQDHCYAVGFCATPPARHGYPRRHRFLRAAVQPVDHQCAWGSVADVCGRQQVAGDLCRDTVAAQPSAGTQS